jgi:hypothetical protein
LESADPIETKVVSAVPVGIVWDGILHSLFHYGSWPHRFIDRNQEQSHRLCLAKAISDVAVGQDINWVCGVVFQFLADLTDENPKVSAFVSEARTT